MYLERKKKGKGERKSERKYTGTRASHARRTASSVIIYVNAPPPHPTELLFAFPSKLHANIVRERMRLARECNYCDFRVSFMSINAGLNSFHLLI